MFARLFCLFNLVILAWASQSWDHWRFNEWENIGIIPFRLIDLMRSVYADTCQKINVMNPQRFAYEESPHYEQGFVFSEIMERYKKMVEQIKQLTTYKSNTVYTCIDRVEFVQKLYFEIYHLVNMLHEIPKKYQHIPGFEPEVDGAKQISNMREQYELEKLDRKNKAKKAKLMNKLREKMIKQGLGEYLGVLNGTSDFDSSTKRQRNTRWPYDYGWEPEEWVDQRYKK